MGLWRSSVNALGWGVNKALHALGYDALESSNKRPTIGFEDGTEDQVLRPLQSRILHSGRCGWGVPGFPVNGACSVTASARSHSAVARPQVLSKRVSEPNQGGTKALRTPVSPFQGWGYSSHSNPGRCYAAVAAALCPGLGCGAPSGRKGVGLWLRKSLGSGGA